MLEYTEEIRREALSYWFGLLSPSSEHLDSLTGCKRLLTRPMFQSDWPDADEYNGFCHVKDHDALYARNVLAKRMKGSWPYYCGIIRGWKTMGDISINYRRGVL